MTMTKIESNGKRIITLSDIHADIHSLIICLRDCGQVITGKLTYAELENELNTNINISYNNNEILYLKSNREPFDTSLGFTWSNFNTIVVIVGDIIDGKRTINNEISAHEYPQIEFKLLAFINALIKQGGEIYKCLGNHEVMNIVNPDHTYLFNSDKTSEYIKINNKVEFRNDIFKLDHIGYHELFYENCYILLQIDNNIFVHGQLVGENYTYYDVLNDVLNYDILYDVETICNKQELLDQITFVWYEFFVLLIYKTLYVKDIVKWIDLYNLLVTDYASIYAYIANDIEEILNHFKNDPVYEPHVNNLNTCLVKFDEDICMMEEILNASYSNREHFGMTIKEKFDKMKMHIFKSYLNVDGNELWNRHYGTINFHINPRLIETLVDTDLEKYNFGNTFQLAERIIIGHCTQNTCTSDCRVSASYSTVLHDESNDMIERLIEPCVVGYSHYNTKHNNLIFGITIDCKSNTKPNFYKLYRVDVGVSRGFDVYSDYQTLFEQLDVLESLEDLFCNSNSDQNYPIWNNSEDCTDCILDINSSDESTDEHEHQSIENIKRTLTINFLKMFISRCPQVLEINQNTTSIVRATLKNILINQPRTVMNKLVKNKYLMKIVQDGGIDLT